MFCCLIYFLIFQSGSSFDETRRQTKFVKLDQPDTKFDKSPIDKLSLVEKSYFASKRFCFLKCLKNSNCLTLVLIKIQCLFFSSDPRISDKFFIIDQASHIKMFLYGMSQDSDRLNCFVSQSEASRETKNTLCEMEDKIIDSKCDDFGEWEVNYIYPCDGSQLIANKTRYKNCSSSFNGGKNCEQRPLQVMELLPRSVIISGTRLNYHLSSNVCKNSAKSNLFSNIAMLAGLVEKPNVLTTEESNLLTSGCFYVNATSKPNSNRFFESVGNNQTFSGFCSAFSISNLISVTSSDDILCLRVCSGELQLTLCNFAESNFVCDEWRMTYEEKCD